MNADEAKLARAAVEERNALGQDMYLLSEIVLSLLGTKRWWTRRRLVDTACSWLKGSAPRDIDHIIKVYERCGLVVRRCVACRTDRFALPWRAKGQRGHALRAVLDDAARRHRRCINAAREMAHEQRARRRLVER
jgi:hypothetical protein